MTHETKIALLATTRIALVFCLVALIGGPVVAQPESKPQPVHKVKAAFVFRFAAYVEWPEDAFDKESPLRIGVLRDENVSGAIEDITAGKSVDGRAIEVQYSTDIESLLDCQIVFIRYDEEGIADHLKRFAEANILTISDDEDFTRHGGVITLVENGRRLAIEVNVNAADRAKLKISSKLLDLATVVRDELG